MGELVPVLIEVRGDEVVVLARTLRAPKKAAPRPAGRADLVIETTGEVVS